ncbi:MAG: adenylate/guanylate cyclase domain-containing protein [Cyanobacteria bacterium P01_F01_bin.116]
MELAPAIVDYLVAIATQDSFAYLHITPNGQLLDWGGELARYSLQNLKSGDPIENHLGFLTGFLPMAAPSEVLPKIHIETDLIVDVHLIKGTQESWVLLMDTTATLKQQQQLQQKGNDLSLLRHQYNKLLNQCLAAQSPKISASTISNNQKDISVLLVKICDLTQYSQHTTPNIILKTLNTYISLITQIIVEEGGVINHILGETAVALFGLLPGHRASPQQAVHAARRIIRRFHNNDMLPIDSTSLGVGVVITTGHATAGVVHNQGHSRFNAIGNHVYHVSQLAIALRPGALFIDSTTFESLPDSENAFESIALPTQAQPFDLYQMVSLA